MILKRFYPEKQNQQTIDGQRKNQKEDKILLGETDNKR